MAKINIFFDSSALISAIITEKGAARVLLLLSENSTITISVTEQVIAEVERNIARKIPKILPLAREMIRASKIRIYKDPQKSELINFSGLIRHAPDLPILVSAIQGRVDDLVTLNRRHFIDDPQVAVRIGTPGDALDWLRGQLAKTSDSYQG